MRVLLVVGVGLWLQGCGSVTEQSDGEHSPADGGQVAEIVPRDAAADAGSDAVKPSDAGVAPTGRDGSVDLTIEVAGPVACVVPDGERAFLEMVCRGTCAQCQSSTSGDATASFRRQLDFCGWGGFYCVPDCTSCP